MDRALRILFCLYLLSACSNDGGELPPEQDTSCDLCRVELERIVELRSDQADLLPSMGASVGALPGGRFAVSTLFRLPQIALFEPDGTVSHVYVARGDGPGEFRRDPYLFTKGDTVVALDPSGRMLFLSDSLTHLRTHEMAATIFMNAAIMENGLFIVDQRLDRGGGRIDGFTALSSLGEVSGSGGPSPSSMIPIVIAQSTPQEFYAIVRESSELHLFGQDLKERRTVVIARPWFDAYNEGKSEGAYRRPRNTAVLPLDGDRAAILTWVADTLIAPIVRDPTVMLRPAEEDPSHQWNSRIEIIALSTGEVIGLTDRDEALFKVQGANDLVFSTRFIEFGHTAIDVWRLRVLPNPQGRSP